MILGALHCKLCSKEIDPPEILLNESPEDRDKRIIARLLKHLQKRAEMERERGGPHLQAIQHAAQTCMHISANLNGALLTGNFELPEDLEIQRQSLLKQVHEMTRTVRVSDDELDSLLTTLITEDEPEFGRSELWEPMSALFRDFRDRYESLGKYAPQPANAPAAPQLVKQ